MGKESHLMLMSVEKELVKCFDLDELVTEFALLRPRRYPLIIIILLHLYSAFLDTQSALHSKGIFPHPPPVCSIHLDDATAAIFLQKAHHTPAYG